MIVEFEVKLPVEVKPEGRWFIARCTLLDVYSQGESEDEALNNAAEALQLFLISCFERGVLDEVLKNCGFQAITPETVVTEEPLAPGIWLVNVPLPFMIPPKSECRA